MTSRLFTTYYRERRPDRRAELDLCLALNAMAFDHPYILSEGNPTSVGEWRLTSQRQKYRDLIDWAAAESGPDDLNVIANCDILIPQSSVEAMQQIQHGDAYCLSRYEIGPGGEHRLNDSDWSQDVWAFRGPPRVNGGDYFFGVPGCDNRFAREIQESGYAVSNPSKSIKTFHIHNSQQRTPTNTRAHRVDPPYLLPKPSHLGEPTEFRYVDSVEEIRKPRSQPVAPAVTQ